MIALSSGWWLLCAFIGLAAGTAAGLFGIGGGIIIVPMLILLLSLPQQSAIAISLVVILLPVGLPAILQYWNAGKLQPDHLKFAAIVAIGVALGSYFGAKLSLQLPELVLRRLFACLLVLVALKMWFSR
ncbi:MAG: sulfite exporter TauE/SafE family protein [Alphaproteobacteria bacterium]|nr:sulfite exporter TauE/SafE family protein [Alphaproteobacteria bacterium]